MQRRGGWLQRTHAARLGLFETVPNWRVLPSESPVLTVCTDHGWLGGQQPVGTFFLMTVDTSATGTVTAVSTDPSQRCPRVAEQLSTVALAAGRL